ncbi:hypothetical protein B0T20DRAFT_424822 [Sordaria brevicollis]|uniref:Uncharacterized protein n=1 Tax=Sordaria brevicollis TaxID=83679 RepID=A0AAE0U2Y6_SORBR|nr:hypothetical protein B0T20DRAFT_424822 [Sordaria brevicollis]
MPLAWWWLHSGWLGPGQLPLAIFTLSTTQLLLFDSIKRRQTAGLSNRSPIAQNHTNMQLSQQWIRVHDPFLSYPWVCVKVGAFTA